MSAEKDKATVTNCIKVAKKMQERMRVTKVVATRSIKTKSGDFFCGISSAFTSTQEEGQGADLNLLAEDKELSSLTLQEARIAQVLLALEATKGALRAAMLEGALTVREYESRVSIADKNAIAHLSRLVPKGTDPQALVEQVVEES